MPVLLVLAGCRLHEAAHLRKRRLALRACLTRLGGGGVQGLGFRV